MCAIPALNNMCSSVIIVQCNIMCRFAVKVHIIMCVFIIKGNNVICPFIINREMTYIGFNVVVLGT